MAEFNVKSRWEDRGKRREEVETVKNTGRLWRKEREKIRDNFKKSLMAD